MLKIGNISLRNSYILAPMAGLTTPPTRRISCKLGAAAAVTEMVSAAGTVYGEEKTLAYLSPYEGEDPLWVQLFGADTSIMAEASKIAKGYGAKIIDLNFGCPVKKVIKTGAGCAMMRDAEKAAEITRAVKDACGLPITAKIRAGWDEKSINYIEFSQKLIDAGVDLICLHPRTRAQGFSGRANWGLIKKLKEAVSVPILGSGDLFTYQDTLKMIAETGCDGAMIARGAMGNPWIFKELLEERRIEVSPEEKFEVIMEHLRLTVAYFRAGEHKAVKSFRQHIVWYSKGIPGASALRRKMSELNAVSEVEAAIRELLLSGEGSV